MMRTTLYIILTVLSWFFFGKLFPEIDATVWLYGFISGYLGGLIGWYGKDV
jgi:hypothetical protein